MPTYSSPHKRAAVSHSVVGDLPAVPVNGADAAVAIAREYPAYDYQNPKIEHVLARLENVSQPDPNVQQYTACCLAHNDGRPSFSMHVTADGKLVFICHAGCTFEQIYEALGRPPLDGYACDGQDRPAPAIENVPLQEPPTDTYLEILDRIEGSTYVNAPNAKEDWSDHLKSLQSQADASVLTDIAKDLSVEASGLRSLGVSCDAHGKLTYPEFDGAGCVCGIATRQRTGEKLMVTGSRRGLAISTALRELSGPLYCCEGLSDTAALLTMGLAAVGRPSATGGITHLADFLRTFPNDRRIVVLGEMDAKSDGRWPGKEGAETTAEQLSEFLQREVEAALPPGGAKDVRAWLQQMSNCGEAA